MGGPCPSAGELERLARGEPVSEAARSHAARCEACRGVVEEIRENDRFLGDARTILAGAMDVPPGGPARARLASDAVRGFELLEEISRGGQGVVYRAVQRATKRAAAIKVLLGGAFASDRQRHRFEREVEIAARLRHPNIVSVFESGQTTDGTPYVAMEYVEGVPLDEFVEERFGALKRSDRERINGVVDLVARIASGVGHAHTSGVIHRDLKPSNILVDREGNPRVLDFGLARAAEPSRDVSTTREFVGTPAYASPEQLAGDPSTVNARADVYAFGMIMYLLLTGRHPYPADGTLAELARHAIGTEPTPPSRIVKRLPSDLETIALKCLAKEPERRYANAMALASDLEDYLEGRAISARRDSAAYVLHRLALRHRIPAIAVAVVLLTVLGAAVGLAILAGDLDRARRDAERLLVESDVQRARLMARTGNAWVAERVIWEHALTSTDVHEPDLLIQGSPDAVRDAWALAEIYASSACMLRIPTDRAYWCAGFTSDGTGLWAIDRTGARWRWTLEGKIIDRTDSLFEPMKPSIDSISQWDGRTTYVTRAGELARVRFDSTPAYEPLMTLPATGISGSEPPPGGSVIPLRGRQGPMEGNLLLVNPDDPSRVTEIDADAYSIGWSHDAQGLLLLVGTGGGPDARIDFRRPPDWVVSRSVRLPIPIQWPTNGGFRHPSLSADNTMLLCTAGDNIFLLDLTRPGTPLLGNKPLLGPIGSELRFTESGEIVVGLMDGNVHILSVPELAVRRSIACGGVYRTVFSERHQSVLASYEPRGIGIYSIADRHWLHRIPARDGVASTVCVDIAPDGTLAWGDDDGKITIVPRGDRALAHTIQAHGCTPEGNFAVNSVRFSPDGSAFVSAGMDGSVREFSIDGRQLRELYPAGSYTAWSGRYAPDGSAIAAGFSSGAVCVWRGSGSEASHLMTLEGKRVAQVAFSPDGARLACGMANAQPLVLDARSGEVLATLEGHGRSTRAVEWSADGKWIITGSDDTAVRVWDARTYKLVRSITGLPWAPFDLRLHPHGNILFATGRGGDLLVLDPERGTELARLAVAERSCLGLAVSRDGRRVALCGQFAYIGLIDLDRLAAPIRGNEGWWRAMLAGGGGEGASVATERAAAGP